jgi:RecA-family ATPase
MNGALIPIAGERDQVKAPQEPRFRLVPFDDLRVGAERRYLVKGIIPRVGLIVVWGPPKCGKSFWMYDTAMHVALGWSYRGRRVQQGAVVYCAFEGAHGFRARAEAFRLRHLAEEHDPVPFYLVDAPMDLVADHGALIESIRSQCDAPAAVVLDTLNRSLRGSESDDKDMAAYVRASDTIRDPFECAVALNSICAFLRRSARRAVDSLFRRLAVEMLVVGLRVLAGMVDDAVPMIRWRIERIEL